MKIQAITSWQNGEELQGTDFNLNVINDNLSTSAIFYYTISTEQISHMETVVVIPEIPAYDEIVDGETIHHNAVPAVTTEVLVIDTPSVTLTNGNVTMDGTDYQTWDSTASANEWAYNWAATKLNLVIIPNQVFA